MPRILTRLWNGIRWGSAEGPEIFIDWENQRVTFLRCSDRMTVRLLGWLRTSHPLGSVTVIDENGATNEGP